MVSLRPRRASPYVRLSRPLPKVRDVVEVHWEDRGQAFRGRIVKRFRAKGNNFLVSYDDGDKIWHDLDEHYWRLVGENDWVPPCVLWEDETSSKDANAAERSHPAAKRRCVLDKRDGPKHENETKKAIRKRTTQRNANKLPERELRKSNSALSASKLRRSPRRNRAPRSYVAPQSEVSTQLSSSRVSDKENPRTKGHATPIITADNHLRVNSAMTDGPVDEKQTSANAITTSSVGSNDQRVPPRKRKRFQKSTNP